MDHIITLEVYQVALSYIFIIILLLFARLKGISREKLIIISTLRMTIQLIFMAYVLVYVLDANTPIYTIIIIIIMQLFSIFNIYKRCNYHLSNQLKKIIAFSMLLGTLVNIIFFLFVVIRITPWYNARYFIPISGMLIGNSMTGISIGVNNLIEGIYSHKQTIECSLMLGATPKKACKSIIDKSFDSAILPTLNSMLGMGIVFLPGMMTGQLLSGMSPITAISYQIVIMMGIVGSVSMTVFIFTNLAYKSFFNKDAQLIVNE